MNDHGFYPPSIVVDGKIHRFPTSSNGKDDAGYYCFSELTDCIIGYFGCWRAGTKHVFCSKNESLMTQSEKIKFDEEKRNLEKKRIDEEKILRENAVKKANEIMAKVDKKATHSYIERKKINMLGGAGVLDGVLCVPCYNSKMQLINVERITNDSKKPLYGGERKGVFSVIGDIKNGETLLLCEGYATGCSLHMATGRTVIIAFNAGNLSSVAGHFKNHTLIICADNDKNSIGDIEAKKAASVHGNARVVVSPIDSDFNDLHVSSGLQAVSNFIFPKKANSVNKNLSNSMPFRILGRCSGRVFYMLADGQIYDYAPHSHNKQVLLAIAPLDFWLLAHGNDKNKLMVDEAVDWLLRQSENLTYSPNRVRGRGAWMDDDKIIIHQGDQVFITESGDTVSSDEFNSEYIYPKKSPINKKCAPPLTDRQTMIISDIFDNIPAETQLQRELLAGWVVCSQISGVLDWRPHIWMTGAKSTGKSWVVTKIIKPLMGENVLFVQSSTTEAGIRQSLCADALPVLFDEAEGNSERSRGNIQRVLELARQASSSDGGVIAKGTQGGEAMRFNVRSCFCFSSIIDGVLQNSDKSRITNIEIDKNKHGTDEGYKLLTKLKSHLTQEFCSGFFWRIVMMADTIKHNAMIFSDIIGKIIDDSRAGEQLGALLAGRHALIENRKCDHEYGESWLAQYDFAPHKASYAMQDDGESCLNAIMTFFIDHKEKRANIGDLLMRMSKMQHFEEEWEIINRSLGAKGLRVTDDHRLCIANSHHGLATLLRDTPYAIGWDKVLARQATACRGDSASRFGGVVSRYVSFDLKKFMY